MPGFSHTSSFCLAGGLAKPLHEILLDARAVAGAGIELTYQASGAGAQAPRHLAEVLFRHLAHRAVELELLDAAQRRRLLLFEGGARALADHGAPVVLFRAERTDGAQGCYSNE